MRRLGRLTWLANTGSWRSGSERKEQRHEPDEDLGSPYELSLDGKAPQLRQPATREARQQSDPKQIRARSQPTPQLETQLPQALTLLQQLCDRSTPPGSCRSRPDRETPHSSSPSLLSEVRIELLDLFDRVYVQRFREATAESKMPGATDALERESILLRESGFPVVSGECEDGEEHLGWE